MDKMLKVLLAQVKLTWGKMKDVSKAKIKKVTSMEIGHWADKKIPANENNEGIKVNSHGYRCREWNPMPDGKKNVVILGCSHTFGVGHPEDTHWVAHLSKHNTKLLRYWNLAVPGCSADKMTRILYGAEKILEPKIIGSCIGIQYVNGKFKKIYKRSMTWLKLDFLRIFLTEETFI